MFYSLFLFILFYVIVFLFYFLFYFNNNKYYKLNGVQVKNSSMKW